MHIYITVTLRICTGEKHKLMAVGRSACRQEGGRTPRWTVSCNVTLTWNDFVRMKQITAPARLAFRGT